MESTTRTAAPTETFTVDVEPRFDGLTPLYDVSVYRVVTSGVCGPADAEEGLTSLAAVDRKLEEWGFERTSEFGPVCANGFATAPLTKLPQPNPADGLPTGWSWDRPAR